VFDTAWGAPPIVAAPATAGTVVTLAPFDVGMAVVGDAAPVALVVRGTLPPDGLDSNVGGLV